jgi:hypothetical protein
VSAPALALAAFCFGAGASVMFTSAMVAEYMELGLCGGVAGIKTLSYRGGAVVRRGERNSGVKVL